MGYPLNGMNFGGNPPHRPGPHGPGHHWNDTECAVEIPPWENCCGDDSDDCLCITSADTSAWDSVYSTVCAQSAYWDSKSPLNTSAWDDVVDTVSSYSASWASGKKGFQLASDLLTSGNYWNKVSAIDEMMKSVITSGYIEGNGTINDPVRLNKLRTELWDNIQWLIGQLYDIDGNKILEGNIDYLTRNWVTKKEYEKLYEYYLSIYDAWQTNEMTDSAQWAAISRLSGGPGGGGDNSNWVYSPDMTAANASEYKAVNTIYYTDQW